MKKQIITITIEHNLTPFHTESMEGMLKSMLEGLKYFWNSRSVKDFDYKIIKNKSND
jgi:hypothetical protein